MRFHHLGLAARDAHREWASLQLLGYSPEGEPFSDALQGVIGQFLVGDGPRIEVLCSLPDARVLEPWLQRGVKLYHLAFESSDIGAATENLIVGGAQVVSPPKPAVAFDERAVTFVMLPNMLLIELIQEPS